MCLRSSMLLLVCPRDLRCHKKTMARHEHRSLAPIFGSICSFPTNNLSFQCPAVDDAMLLCCAECCSKGEGETSQCEGEGRQCFGSRGGFCVRAAGAGSSYPGRVAQATACALQASNTESITLLLQHHCPVKHCPIVDFLQV